MKDARYARHSNNRGRISMETAIQEQGKEHKTIKKLPHGCTSSSFCNLLD